MIWFIIYLVGCVVSVFIDVIYILKDDDYTFGDIFPTLIWSLSSWLSVIVMLLISIDGDKVIFKKKG